MTPVELVAVSLRQLADALEADSRQDAPAVPARSPDRQCELPWSALLWVVPPQTRLHVPQLALALGLSRHAVYRLTSAKRVPHRKLEGKLTFVVSEIRQWLHDNELIVVAGHTTSLPPVETRRAG